jgi:hypothetical protein
VRERVRESERGRAMLLGRARVLLGRASALLGRAGVSERGRGRDAAGPRGWAEPEGERRKRPDRSFWFFFFKNVNSNSICLFH